MAKVLGIGGVFIKSPDKEKLRAWYRDMLGFEIQEWGGAQLWSRPTDPPHYATWNPFASDTKYFEPSTRDVMLNLRVDSLDRMLTRLRDKGARVIERREDGEFGKFGYVMDPDGTLIELWEPPPDVSTTG